MVSMVCVRLLLKRLCVNVFVFVGVVCLFILIVIIFGVSNNMLLFLIGVVCDL